MYILGISAYYHDSAACILHEDNIIAAVQEERFTRKKHDPSFPKNAIQYCLEEADITPSQLDYIVFYEKPFLKFERILETYLAFAPRGFRSFSKSMPIWIKEKLFQKSLIKNELQHILGSKDSWNQKLLFSDHHLSHAASAFYPSPFEESAILTMDGVGEWTTTSLAVGKKENIEVHKEIHFPHSLGLIYSAFTYYCGFKVNSGEYKLMGLAPYGNPKYIDEIKNNLINIKDDGSFQLDMSYFDYCTNLKMTNSKFDKLFGGPPRITETDITQREMDVAASIQQVTEEIVMKLAKSVAQETGQKNLCLAGGVALNCVANGVLKKSKIFDDIWIQPAAGDAGGALGAALVVYFLKLGNKRKKSLIGDKMQGSYLGPAYSSKEIKHELNELGAIYSKYEEKEVINYTAEAITQGKAIGWMNGRMEFGPRALGARSIIADARSSKMQKQLNLKVKYRESFRPFAPSVLAEHSSNWFNIEGTSPYMLIVSDVVDQKKLPVKTEDLELIGIDKLNTSRSQVPAITHVDYSARVQTVHKETNPRFHALISRFYELTDCPVIINTSFNVRGEPIVCNATDAFNCFMGTDLDFLVIENIILKKEEQNPSLVRNYRDKYELD